MLITQNTQGLTMVLCDKIFHMRGNPFYVANALEVIETAALVYNAQGKIVFCGPAAQARSTYPYANVTDLTGHIIIPGFVDTHTHFTQEMITGGGAYGLTLLDWLNKITFRAETKFRDASYANKVIRLFFSELLSHGTVAINAFGSQFLEATNLAFEIAQEMGIWLINGLNLSDQEIPIELVNSCTAAEKACGDLYERWHGKGRLLYSIMPRFAICCSPRMLETCGALYKQLPTSRFHTHYAEMPPEVALTLALHPGHNTYAGVYEQHGCLGSRTVLAHSVHPTNIELEIIARSNCSVAHCPLSNTTLGSGRFPLRSHINHRIRLGLGTDKGAAPSPSIARQMVEVFGQQMLASPRELVPTPAQLFFLGTLGGAEALGLPIGNLVVNKHADFLAIDPNADSKYLPPLLEQAASPAEVLYLLMNYLTPNHIKVYLAGRPVDPASYLVA